jgi:hypothetical protein
VRLACLLHGNRFGGYRFKAFRRAAAYLPKLDRSLVTAFPSPATAPAFTDSIPGSKVPACYFAVLSAGFHARSAIRLRCRNWFAPIPAASTLQARCISARKLIRPLSPSPLPSGSFRSLGIKAFNGRGCRPVRLPNTPDLRSLPAACSITRLATDHRPRSATFPEACCSSNLLEPPSLCSSDEAPVNEYLVRRRTFQQDIAVVFRISYGDVR